MKKTLDLLKYNVYKRTRWCNGRLAQLEEHLVYTERVGSSNLSAPTNTKPPFEAVFCAEFARFERPTGVGLEKRKMSGGHFSDDRRRLLLSKESEATEAKNSKQVTEAKPAIAEPRRRQSQRSKTNLSAPTNTKPPFEAVFLCRICEVRTTLLILNPLSS